MRPPGPAQLGRLDQDLVVDVGDVGDDRDLVAVVLEPPAQHVEHDLFVDVADVRRALHGQTTVVDPDLPG